MTNTHIAARQKQSLDRHATYLVAAFLADSGITSDDADDVDIALIAMVAVVLIAAGAAAAVGVRRTQRTPT